MKAIISYHIQAMDTPVDILTAIAELPCDVVGIIAEFHRLNGIEEEARRHHSKAMDILNRLAASAKWECSFPEYVFAELDVIHVWDRDDDVEYLGSSDVVDTRDYPAICYGVDVFDSVACRQIELKNNVLYQIEKLHLIE